MDINDILQMVLLCSAILIPLTYYFHNGIKTLMQALKHAILPPRYLKKEGILRSNHSARARVNND